MFIESTLFQTTVQIHNCDFSLKIYDQWSGLLIIGEKNKKWQWTAKQIFQSNLTFMLWNVILLLFLMELLLTRVCQLVRNLLLLHFSRSSFFPFCIRFFSTCFDHLFTWFILETNSYFLFLLYFRTLLNCVQIVV